MAITQSAISRAPRPSSLADVLDLILDKGLVIDLYVRVSAVGIEILTIDARIVIASVDTYLRFAEAVNRLDLRATETQGIQGLVQGKDSDGDDESSNGGSQRQRSLQRGGRALGKGEESGGGKKQPSRQPQTASKDDNDDNEDEDGGLLNRIVERGRRQ